VRGAAAELLSGTLVSFIGSQGTPSWFPGRDVVVVELCSSRGRRGVEVTWKGEVERR